MCVGAGERKSKRARKGRAPLTLSSTLTLGALRLRIFEAVGVHPLNARLFVRCVAAAEALALCLLLELCVLESLSHIVLPLSCSRNALACGYKGRANREKQKALMGR